MKRYPRQLHPYQTLDGRSHVVQNATEEETFTGVKMNEDGTPFVAVDPPRAVPVGKSKRFATPEVEAALNAGAPVDGEAAADLLGI